jgi:hypothetical protein
MNYSGKSYSITQFFNSVGDDQTIWKWDINGEHVSTLFIDNLNDRNPKLWISMLKSSLLIGFQLLRALKRSLLLDAQMEASSLWLRLEELRRVLLRHIVPPLFLSNGVMREQLSQPLERTDKSRFGQEEELLDLK